MFDLQFFVGTFLMSLEILQKLEQERNKWLANYALYQAGFCETEMNRDHLTSDMTVKVNQGQLKSDLSNLQKVSQHT